MSEFLTHNLRGSPDYWDLARDFADGTKPPVFGQFSHRQYKPTPMANAHWHGHIEANWVTGGDMVYLFDGAQVVVPEGELAVFWAGIPHQSIKIVPNSETPVTLQIIDMPLDAFLFMQNISTIRTHLLNGNIVKIPKDSCDHSVMERWKQDYLSGVKDRRECMMMEYNAMMRRANASQLELLHTPWIAENGVKTPTASNMHHVVAMIRAVADRIGERISTREIASITGLNSNYGANLFSKSMHVSLKQFITRMQLVQARMKLIETDHQIEKIAYECGFNSASQFYAQFRAIYNMSPGDLRNGLHVKH